MLVEKQYIKRCLHSRKQLHVFGNGVVSVGEYSELGLQKTGLYRSITASFSTMSQFPRDSPFKRLNQHSLNYYTTFSLLLHHSMEETASW